MNNPYEFFNYKGEKYGVGTIIKTKSIFKHVGYEYNIYYGNADNGKYIFFNKDGGNVGFKVSQKDLELWDIVDIEKHEIGEHVSKYKPGKATSYIDYSSGWVWYILIMSVLFIFKDRLFGWIITTIIFINWRKKKRGE